MLQKDYDTGTLSKFSGRFSKVLCRRATNRVIYSDGKVNHDHNRHYQLQNPSKVGKTDQNHCTCDSFLLEKHSAECEVVHNTRRKSEKNDWKDLEILLNGKLSIRISSTSNSPGMRNFYRLSSSSRKELSAESKIFLFHRVGLVVFGENRISNDRRIFGIV